MGSTLTEGPGAKASSERTSAFLYRVLNADAPASGSTRLRLLEADTVVLGRADAHGATLDAASRTLAVGVADRLMSSQHARLSRVMGEWVLEDLRSKNGVRLRGAPLERATLADGDVFEAGRTFFVFRAAQPAPEGQPAALDSSALAPAAPGLATLSPRLEARFDELARLAPSAVPVALQGASGTGKEVVARALHALSGRAGPLVAVNCGALPDELVESELFGHKKGAFSGATEDRPGLVRAAHGGTLLLDEVGDLPLEAQPALLRVLQERQVVPVGGTTAVPVDVRVVSATHRELAALASGGLFRDDLRARLTGYELRLPGLAERREDLGLLVAALLRRLVPARWAAVSLSIAAARALLLSAWPLNVRELEKALEAAVVLAGAGPIELEHLPAALRAPAPVEPEEADAPLEPEEVERKARLEALLREHAGNVSAVARALGKARMQVQRWLGRYGLDPRAFRP